MIARHPGSFRDPLGTVFCHENQIIRGLTAEGFNQFNSIKQTGLLNLLEQNRQLIKSKESQLTLNSSHDYYLEHELIPFISYPYEWPFALLKSAALLHLSIQLNALKQDVVLQDASAYNVQFIGISPIFIDILSFRPYQSGELWGAHRQFCEQFLNPLLLSALKGIPYQDWYRGTLEGIATESLARLMPFKSWFSWRSLIHVLLPARAQSKDHAPQQIDKIKKSTLSKAVYISFLEQLEKWITQLKPYKQNPTTWENYTKTRLYADEEVTLKKQFISEFITKIKPNMLWDFGCNDGEFAELALKNGAGAVIGFDVDLGALENAVQRATINQLNFLPLYQQMTNPTPKQGWLLEERTDVLNRGKPNAFIALAFIHHLAIGHNIPLREVVHYFLDLAPVGVIEFVQKTDPTVKKMLALKGDIFPNYSEEAFIHFLTEKAQIVRSLRISQSGRSLYWYQCK